MIQLLLDVRFVRFVLVGGLNTVFGYAAFALFIVLGLHYALAALLSTVCGILFNFKTTGRIVFDNRDNSLITRFFGVYAITYILSVSFLRLTEGLQWNVLIAGAILMPPMAVLSYTLNRLFVFGGSP